MQDIGFSLSRNEKKFDPETRHVLVSKAQVVAESSCEKLGNLWVMDGYGFEKHPALRCINPLINGAHPKQVTRPLVLLGGSPYW